ncbi:hypothetical protein GCM10010306_087900 [Streptomyces umbrinus]|nr:hypothetical protein GCM10010306_087900 [Streptomyces umbrinus]
MPRACWDRWVSERKPYRSDLTDGQSALIEPVLTAWKKRHRSVNGHQGRYSMWEIVNSILYQSRTGCQWAPLPNDLPPKSATYYYFGAWRDDGTDRQIHELLHCQVRERNRRLEDPTLVILDPQGVRVVTGAPRSRRAKTPRNGCLAASGAWPWTSSVWSSPSPCWARVSTATPPASLC